MTETSFPGSEKSLQGRRALITGGGAGLGLVFAEALVQAGAALVICGRRADVLEESAKRLRANGGEVEAIPADVSCVDDISVLGNAVGAVDILVNNAGYSIRRNSWLDVTFSEWQEVLAVNLQAPFMLAQTFVPGMMERGWGRVINISSVYGVVATNPHDYPDMPPDNTSYVAAKHGLIGLTKNLALRVADKGVTVNAISPGIFAGVSRTIRSDGVTPGVRTAAKLTERIPMHRTGSPDDLRALIVFIAGPDSSYITGQTFVVDGGFTIS